MNLVPIVMYMIIGIIALMMIGIIAAIVSFYKKPRMGEAIIRTGVGGTKVALNQGIMVVPVLHRMEIMNVSMTVIHTNFMDENALISKDNTKVDVKINFPVRVNYNDVDIVAAANTVGCKRSFSKKALNEVFGGKFAETVKTVSKDLTFEEMQNHDNFKLHILQSLDPNLNGYLVEDCIIDYLKKSKPQNANSLSV